MSLRPHKTPAGLITIALVIALIIAFAGAEVGGRAAAQDLQPPRAPGFKRCGSAGLPETRFDLRVRRTSCRRGRAAVRRFDYNVEGGGRIPGWRCRQAASYYDGAFYRCSRRRAKIQFGVGA